jgi:hypothetical protein
MLDTRQRLAEICRPYLERAMRRGGHATAAGLAEEMGISRALLSRASHGQGPALRVMSLLDRGGVNPDDRAEAGYLLGLWGYGQRGGES